MAKSSGTIERDAVNYINDCFNQNDKIHPKISINDREVSFDGYIELYENSNQKKEDLICRCNVQVKGQKCSSFQDLIKKKIVYNKMKISDLYNYAQEGGIIFFVVRIFYSNNGRTRQRKAYYASLLEYDLQKLLAQKGNQKTTTIYLEELLPEAEQLEKILYDHFVHRQMQLILLQKQSNQIVTQSDRDSSHTGQLIISKISDLFNGKAKYLYEEITKDFVKPVGKVKISRVNYSNVPLSVYVREKEYFTSVTFSVMPKSSVHKIMLNQGLYFILRKHKKDSFLSLRYDCSLENFIKILNFFIAAKQNRGFFIGRKNEVFIEAFDCQMPISIDTLKKLYIDLINIKSLLQYLHVDKVVKINMLPRDSLVLLYELIVLKKGILLNNLGTSIPKSLPIRNILREKIGLYKFILLGIIDTRGTFQILDFFDTIEHCQSKNTKGEFLLF